MTKVDPVLLGGAVLEITLCNNACYIAECVKQREPRWDVVLGDVFMCRPSRTPASPRSPSVVPVTRELDGQKFTSLEYDYRWNKTSASARSDEGGFLVADAILEARSSSASPQETTLVLISSVLSGRERRRLHKYLSESDGYIRYFDKAEWDTAGGGPVLLSARLFKWALVDEITWRFSRRLGGLQHPTPRLPLLATSPAMQEAQVRAARLAADRSVRTIFISGPVGSGKKTIAADIAFRRCQLLAGSPRVLSIVARGLDVEKVRAEVSAAALPTVLSVDEITELSPTAQLKLEELVTGAGTLVELALLLSRHQVGYLKKLCEQGLLLDVWLKRAISDFIVLRPLEERREDITALASAVAWSVRPGLSLSSDALDWLQERSWPLNGAQLAAVVNDASRMCAAAIVNATDVSEAYRRVALELNLPTNVDAGPASAFAALTAPGRKRRTAEEKQAIIDFHRRVNQEIRELARELKFNHDLTLDDLRRMKPDLQLWQISQADRLKQIFDRWRGDLKRNARVDVAEIVDNIVFPLHGLTSSSNIKKFKRELRQSKHPST
ncbi:MAG: hypothetical protein HY821_09940 [Acidobacteria bacterium]|nr:hypothetical protein [Acidobacteriota bacterium]